MASSRVDNVPTSPRGPVRPRGLVVMSDQAFADLFDTALLGRLRELVSIDPPEHVTELASASVRERLADVDLLVTGWGTPVITAEVLAGAPRLRAVFHTGGSVKGHISQACWDRGVVVTSARDANAIPVAEFTLGTILLEGKRARTYAARYRDQRDSDDSWRDSVPPAINYRGTVGLIGFSRVGRRVAALLAPFDFDVLVSDPVADEREVRAAGARLVPLEELLASSDIVSLHAPELSSTRGLVDRARLAMLKDGAVLINTARGSLVDTDALIDECRSGRIRAVLDVTEPEPLPAASALYDLAGVELTPHIAGAMGRETQRMTSLTLDEIARHLRGEPLEHSVDGRALKYIA